LARGAPRTDRQDPGRPGGVHVDHPAAAVGEENRGVVGLRPDRLPHEHAPGIAVEPMGLDRRAVASHLVSSYFSAAVLVDDAIGMLEQVQVAHYHQYA
jgi:hypothetical protein